ncbi:MAG: hypothetical protein WBC44_01770 [Planctomycetaceae bacterium]
MFSTKAAPPGPPEDSVESHEDYLVPAHRCRLLISQQRARYESQSRSLRDDGKFVTVPHITTFDGTKAYTLWPEGRDGPWGIIQDDEEFDERRNIHLFGLMLNLRPLEMNGIGPDPSVWSVDKRPAVIDGHECVVLTKPFGESFDRLHVDRNGDLLRRYEQIVKKTGETLVRVDMQYDPDREPPWVPSSWTSRMRDLDQSTNRVDEVKLGIKIPDERFRIAFPKGAYVSILSSREEARKAGKNVSEQFMIAGDNGELLPRRTEIAERTQIANESTTATATSRWPLILAAIGAAALGVALLLWRRYA